MSDLSQRITEMQAQLQEAMRAHKKSMLDHEIAMQVETLKLQMKLQALFSDALLRAAAEPIRIEL